MKRFTSELIFHKHCTMCFSRLRRYQIWENEWKTIEVCDFCRDTEMWMLYGDITDDLDPDYDKKVEAELASMKNEIESDLPRW